MRRRDFIQLLGGAVIAAPCGAAAQTSAKVHRIGLLSPGALITDTSPFGAPLIRGLAKLGYAQGRNLAFERAGAQGHLDRLPRLVEELVASKVDVVHTVGYPAARCAIARRRLAPRRRVSASRPWVCASPTISTRHSRP